MIQVTDIERQTLVLNPDLIQSIEGNECTIILLTNGQQVRVLETPDELIEQVTGQHRSIFTLGRHDFDAAVSFHARH